MPENGAPKIHSEQKDGHVDPKKKSPTAQKPPKPGALNISPTIRTVYLQLHTFHGWESAFSFVPVAILLLAQQGAGWPALFLPDFAPRNGVSKPRILAGETTQGAYTSNHTEPASQF
jgi:hypothetical protein